tara:strand:+ start:111 stop:503 length:393 start_codon:yes stop_codon:yes gene_type:complete
VTHTLSDYLNAINVSKEPLLDISESYTKQSYPPFVVTRCLSYFPDTLFAANEMNTRPLIDSKMHFDFLRGAVRPRKRFSKWLKREDDSRVVALVEYYGMSSRKAREALSVLSEADLEEIVAAVDKGGRSK